MFEISPSCYWITYVFEVLTGMGDVIEFIRDKWTPMGGRAATIVPTPHGKIHRSWERTAGDIKVRLDLPRGLSAKVILPGRRQELVQGKNRWTICHQ